MDIDPNLAATIASIITIILGIVAAKFKVQHTQATTALQFTDDKVVQFENLLRKIIDANKDNAVSVDEFNGIVNAAKTLINK